MCALMLIIVNLRIFYSIMFLVDLSSHGVTDQIQLGCHSDNLDNCFMQISLKKLLFFRISESIHDNIKQICLCLCFHGK